MSSANEEELRNQACGYSRVFFVYLEKSYGLEFNDDEKKSIVTEAYDRLANHVIRHRILQRTMDGLKLTSFLAFSTAALVRRKTITFDLPIQPPALTACHASIEKIASLLKLATSSRIVLQTNEKAYLSNMLFDEVMDNSSTGIGPNGLGATFYFMSKINLERDHLQKI